MKTTTRQHGTNCHVTEAPEDKIAACREIVRTQGYAKIDQYGVDLFSASAIVVVYDALNETNRAKFVSLPLHKMASIAFKCVRVGG